MSAPAPLVAVESNDAAPEPWKARLREAALIALLALALNLAGNGRVSLWDRDEPRYAGCTREMRASGDFIRPTFNAEPRYQKPVLIYWLMLVSSAVGGDNPFGYRLVSALAGVGSCLLTWGLGRRMFGRRVGLLAGLALATAPIVVADSKLATTDATLTLFLVTCQYALWELARRPSQAWAGVFWTGLALATLTKGLIGPLLIAAAGAVSWWWGGPTDYWKRLRWSWGLSIFALLTLPWYLAIGVLTRGAFFRVSMDVEVVGRVTSHVDQHRGFPGYYVVFSLLFFYPWSALLPAALVGAWGRRKAAPEFGFLLGWVVGPLLVLEPLRTKLLHYYLPAYPAAALLGAWLVVALAQAEVNLRRWPLGRVSLALLTGLGIALTVMLLAGALAAPAGLGAPCLVMALVLGPGTLFAMERFQAGASERAAQALVATWAGVLAVVGGWMLPAIEPYRLTQQVARRLGEIATREHATPMLADFKPPGLVVELGRPVPTMGNRAELLEQLRRDGAVVLALNDAEIAKAKADPRLALQFRGTVRGFDVEHAGPRTLQLVLVRPGAPSAVAGRPAEQTRVE